MWRRVLKIVDGKRNDVKLGELFQAAAKPDASCHSRLG